MSEALFGLTSGNIMFICISSSLEQCRKYYVGLSLSAEGSVHSGNSSASIGVVRVSVVTGTCFLGFLSIVCC